MLGLNTDKMALACRPHWRRAQQKDGRAVPPDLTLKPHNLVFPHSLWHLPRCCPSARAQGGCLQVSVSVHKSFKGMSGFPVAFHLTCTVRKPTGFNSQTLWGLLFLLLEPWGGEPPRGAGFPPSFGTTFITFSTAIHRCGASLFWSPHLLPA